MIIIAILIVLFYVLIFLTSEKEFRIEKTNNFERGFEREIEVQRAFNIHFFIILVIFVIFDLEIVLLLGLIIRNNNFLLNSILILAFIIVGFYIE